MIVAAGRGSRAGGDMPKAYRQLGGQPMIRFSLSLFSADKHIRTVQPVIHAEDASLYRAAAGGLDVLPPVFGGATRQASVRAGLEALKAHEPEIVLVHDAARPFASAGLIERAVAAAKVSAARAGCRAERYGESGGHARPCHADTRPRITARHSNTASI